MLSNPKTDLVVDVRSTFFSFFFCRWPGPWPLLGALLTTKLETCSSTCFPIKISQFLHSMRIENEHISWVLLCQTESKSTGAKLKLLRNLVMLPHIEDMGNKTCRICLLWPLFRKCLQDDIRYCLKITFPADTRLINTPSLLRQNYAATSFWRNNDAEIEELFITE